MSKPMRVRAGCASLMGMVAAVGAAACTGVLGDFALADAGRADGSASTFVPDSATEAGSSSSDASLGVPSEAGRDVSEVDAAVEAEAEAAASDDANQREAASDATSVPPVDGAEEQDSALMLDGATPADGGSGCTASVDCPSGQICGFPTTPACSPLGQCFTPPAIQCNAITLGCACDGSEVNIACNGLPGGFAPKPLLQAGPCPLRVNED